MRCMPSNPVIIPLNTLHFIRSEINDDDDDDDDEQVQYYHTFTDEIDQCGGKSASVQAI